MKEISTNSIGKMMGWHRWLTYSGMLLCFISGITWFYFEDIQNLSVNDFKFWVKFHGIVGHLVLIVLGMAFYHHVQICIRMKKNITMGVIFLTNLAVLMASILALFYGQGLIHAQARLVHLIIGTSFCIVFVLHIYIGRRNRSIKLKKSQLPAINGLRI
jgi:hypothetical protein